MHAAQQVEAGGNVTKHPEVCLRLEGLDIAKEDLEELLRVDVDDWRREIPLIEAHYAQFGERLPSALADEVTRLAERLA